MLASSGIGIGELCGLKVSNIQFGKQGDPSKITLAASMTKTRKRRLTFISPEATDLLRDYLGDKINDPNTRIFLEGQGALYMKLMRSVERAGLKKKTEDESRRFALHPYCFRKYFFSNMLAAGVDRGITEGFMGHKFAEDSAYLRMSDKELMNQYSKAAERLSFFTSEMSGAMKERMEQLETENEGLKERLERLEAISVERLILAARSEGRSRKMKKNARRSRSQ